MPRYRIVFKKPPFFLGCLLVILAVMAFQSWRSLGKLEKAPEFSALASTNALQQRLASTDEPAKLKEIALETHKKFVAANSLLDRVFALLRSRERAILTNVGIGMALLLAFYLFELRAPPPE